MLDVHPPHQPTHTWTDFFIHIATIVVGLLIAIGLEQSVEYLHHRSEIHEAREALHQEREENRKIFMLNVGEFHLTRAMLRNNLKVLAYLQKYPGTPEEKLPGVLTWNAYYYPVDDSAWKSVQQSMILSMFPREEDEKLAQFYDVVGHMQASALLSSQDTYEAAAYAATDPDPSHLTPAQVEKEIELTNTALFQNFAWGIWLTLATRNYPDFQGGISLDEIMREGGLIRSPDDGNKLAAAQAQTDQALAAAKAALAEARKKTGPV